LTGFRVLLLSSLLLACGAAQSLGQFNIELINREGAIAPCMGIGPVGGPLAKKCAEMAEQAGFIRVTEVGFAGLTIGTTGKDDGVILAVQKESAAAHAGLEVGDHRGGRQAREAHTGKHRSEGYVWPAWRSTALDGAAQRRLARS
jgi:hypothetical protein